MDDGGGGIVVLWFIAVVLLALIPANIASRKGHDFLPWYIYGFLLFIVALIHSLLLRDEEKERRDAVMTTMMLRASENMKAQPASPDSNKPTKTCPYCAETILRAAKVCRYCNRDLPETTLDRLAADPG